MKTNQVFKPGDLVRWYEDYADLKITRDTGLGVVICENSYMFKSDSVKYTNYRVHRNKHNDVIVCDATDLVKIQ